jgi:hypothetical protein
MKKLLLILIVALLAGCSKDEDTEPKDELAETIWTAPNPIAQLIYGGECTLTVEFFGNSECQVIDRIENAGFSNRTDVFEGTYEIYSNNDSVKWVTDDGTVKGRISGSVIQTTHFDLTGSAIVYTKEN